MNIIIKQVIFLSYLLILFDSGPLIGLANRVDGVKRNSHHRQHHRQHQQLQQHQQQQILPTEFQFTAPVYNLSIFENAVNGTIAVNDQTLYQTSHRFLYSTTQNSLKVSTNSDGGEKVGIFLPRGYHQIQFKIVDGDKQQRFQATSKKLGNFVFLIIEYRHDDILNRELQSDYQLIVRAIAKRKKSNTLEASTTINLRVLDENDNNPMFRQMEYLIEADDKVISISSSMKF